MESFIEYFLVLSEISTEKTWYEILAYIKLKNLTLYESCFGKQLDWNY